MYGVDAMPVEEQAPTSQRYVAPSLAEWERTYAMWTHLLLLAGVFIPVVPTLILWLVKREQSVFVDDHGKEAVNFQISIWLYLLIGGLLSMICIGIPLVIVACGLAIVGMIIAAVAAHRGQYFRYPMSIRLVR